MNAYDFEQWLVSKQAELEAWGKFVVDSISALVRDEIGDERFSTFFKLPPYPRLKSTQSALAKLKIKQYGDAQFDMMDLVGCRFVVLLKSDIAIVERAVAASNSWTAQRDRNGTTDLLVRPSSFEYISTHYVLRCPDETDVGGCLVQSLTACEVQIRTLLQHAYAELGHDRIYKAPGKVPASVLRLLAQSQALMETTDSLFCAAADELDAVNRSFDEWADALDRHFKNCGIEFVATRLDDGAREIFETYQHLLRWARMPDVVACIAPYLDVARRRAPTRSLFQMPMVSAVYWLVANHDDELCSAWPNALIRDDLDQVRSDLGFS